MELGALLSFLPIIAMLAVFYLVIFIPENKRKKKYNAMLKELKTGIQVVTRGGVVGTIVSIDDEHIVVQSGPDRARIKFLRNSISHIVEATETK